MKITAYLRTMLPVAIVLVVAAQQKSGFPLLVLIPFFAAGALYSSVLMFRRPQERKERGGRLATWFVAFAIAGSVQAYWNVASRSDADSAAAAVTAHRERTGSYPASLGEVGLSDEHLKEKWGIRYACRDGKVSLTRPDRFLWLSMHEYDFNARVWNRNAH